MELFKKHIDTIIIMGGILSSFMWMNNKLNHLEKEIAIIKTVLIIKEIMPKQLAYQNDNYTDNHVDRLKK